MTMLDTNTILDKLQEMNVSAIDQLDCAGRN